MRPRDLRDLILSVYYLSVLFYNSYNPETFRQYLYCLIIVRLCTYWLFFVWYLLMHNKLHKNVKTWHGVLMIVHIWDLVNTGMGCCKYFLLKLLSAAQSLYFLLKLLSAAQSLYLEHRHIQNFRHICSDDFRTSYIVRLPI